jgi:beta-carotene 3-hydroxylase
MFGMAYMFVHDGLVHRRFPVGPIGDLPYLQKVAAAHQVGLIFAVSMLESISLVT